MLYRKELNVSFFLLRNVEHASVKPYAYSSVCAICSFTSANAANGAEKIKDWWLATGQRMEDQELLSK